MGAMAEAFAAFAQPLIDRTDGSAEQLQKALSIGALCYTAAQLRVDQREGMFGRMKSTFEMDDEEFDDFRRSILEPMIERHEEMFPSLHGRATASAPEHRRAATSAATEHGRSLWPQPVTAAPAKKQAPVDRYAPCPCNSGKKYKFCCGAKGR